MDWCFEMVDFALLRAETGQPGYSHEMLTILSLVIFDGAEIGTSLVPTELIQQRVTALAAQVQLALSHVEQFQAKTKAQKLHCEEAMGAMKKAAELMHAIQNLAAIELGQK